MKMRAGRRWITTPRQIWRIWALAVTAAVLAVIQLSSAPPPSPEPTTRAPAAFELPTAPKADPEAETARARAVALEAALWGATPASGEAPPPPPPEWHVAGVYLAGGSDARAIVVVEDGKSRPLELAVGAALPDGTPIESIDDFQVCAREASGAKNCHSVHLAPAARARVAQSASAKPGTAGANAKPAARPAPAQPVKK